MDFEWQHRAPQDVTSPFYQLSVQHENRKREHPYPLAMAQSIFILDYITCKIQILTATGPHSTFDSPEKKSLPSLREPNSQPFLFSQQPPATPKSVFNQPAFMTPRKFDLDFSSGAENMSSPENADNEDTPEPPTKNGGNGNGANPRNSLFTMYGRFAPPPAPSPGRGEIPRMGHYSNALARRVHKRRRRDKALDQRFRRDSDDEDESDNERPSSSEQNQVGKPKQQQQQQQQEGGLGQQKPSRMSFSDFFALLEAHPHVPSILSWWAQLVVNLSLFSLAVYVVFGFVSAIRAEFEQAAEEVSDGILAEMATCAKSYVDNRCGGNDRLPALETVCENWDRCMNRDPAKVGRAKVSAHTMAIIINSFIDPISWKAIVCFLYLDPVYLQLLMLTHFTDVLPRYHVNRDCREQLVLPFLQKPSQPTRISTTAPSAVLLSPVLRPVPPDFLLARAVSRIYGRPPGANPGINGGPEPGGKAKCPIPT